MPPKATPRRGTTTRRQAAATEPEPPEPKTAATNTTDTTATATATAASSNNDTTIPIPSSSRPPVQRLQSLKKRTPSGTIGTGGPGPASMARASSARPLSASAGVVGAPSGDSVAGGKPSLKFQPKFVARRSKAEREAIEKLEAQRHRERVAEAAAIQRGRGGRGGRGRGDFGRGRGGGPGGRGGIGLGGAFRGRGGGGTRFAADDSRASSMSRRSRSIIDVGSAAASRDVSSDESDTGILMSIDDINLESGEDYEDDEFDQLPLNKEGRKVPRTVIGKKSLERGAEQGLRPVRVERHEHEERVVSVNMESSSSKTAEKQREEEEAKAQKQKDDDALFVNDDDDDSIPAAATKVTVKEEPTEQDLPMDDAPPHVDESLINDDGLLPPQTIKVRRALKSNETVTAAEPETVPHEPMPTSTSTAAKDPRALLRTREETEEYDRHVQDLQVVKDLLSVEARPPARGKVKAPETSEREPREIEAETDDAEKQDEGGDAADEEEDEEEDKLAGQLFLMQFPPMTPKLVVPGSSNLAPIAADDGTFAQRHAQASALGQSQAPSQREPAAPTLASGFKREEDGVEVLETQPVSADQSGADQTSRSQIVTAKDRQLSAGRVGKLNVHASGRVTMDWGGISFEVNRAVAVDFLQEALIVSSPPTTETEQEQERTRDVQDMEERKVWAMGQLSGKFTVTPNWDAML